MPNEPKLTWLTITRMAVTLATAIRNKLKPVCPNSNCPLNLHEQGRKLTQDELIKRQKELYKRNHPND